MSDRLMGMDEAGYNKMASQHSKTNIFLWAIAGIIYNLITGNILSISTIVLFLHGIFVISFLSIATFFVNTRKISILSSIRGKPSTINFIILFTFTLWYVIDLAFPVVLSILTIKLTNYVVSLF